MAVNLSPIWGAGAQLLDNSGNVLSGGKIYTYAAGTTTQVATYTSNSGVTANSNPIVLNSAGRVPYEIWLTDGQNYKFVLKDSNDVLIGTWDNLSGINSNFIAYTNQQEIQTATAGQTVFNLTTMNYLPGTNSLSVFVDGVNQYGPGAQYAYEETDSTTITFASGLHVGAEVKFTSSQIQNAGVTDASQISYTYPATNAVTESVEERLAQYVSVKDFGAVGDGVTDDTVAIQNAIDAANSKTQTQPVYGFYGTAPTVFFPSGIYKISDELTYYKYSRFEGEQSVINQTDNTKNIFYSEQPYQNEWKNLICNGGVVQIYCLNGGAVPGPGGLEGVLIHIEDCEFYGGGKGITTSIKCQKEAPMGGEQVYINSCRFFSFQKAIWSDFDCTYVNHNYFETRNDLDTTNDSSWFTAYNNWTFIENTLVPGGDTSTGTERYFDNYGNLYVSSCRFGAESGGQPIVYNFTSANQTSGYPYQDAGAIVVNECPILATGVRTDQGIVVAKTGLPKVIGIQNNMWGAIGPYINTDSFTGGISLATWIAGSGGAFGSLYMTFTIIGNSMWGGTLTTSTADDELLFPWTIFNQQQQYQTQSFIPYQTAKSITTEVGLGKSYTQTSTSTSTSIVDTGIYYDRNSENRPELAYSTSAIYDVYVTGNPNYGGNSAYRDVIYGQIEVNTINSGGAAQNIAFYKLSNSSTTISASATFWNGLIESATIPTGETQWQIRIKVAGYVGTTGAQQVVRITKRI